MNASDLMTRELVTLTEDATLGDALAALAEHGVRHLPVLRGRVPVGVVSDRDLRRLEGALAANPASVRDEGPRGDGPDPFDAPIATILEGEVVHIRPDTPVRSVIDTLLEAHVGAVLVVDASGALVRLVSTVDVLRAARDRFDV